MKRILMITRRFIYGGIEEFLLNVFEYSNKSKLKFSLLCLNSEVDQELLKKIEVLGVDYHTLALDKYSGKNKRKYHYESLFNYLNNNHFDVVHVNITNYKMAFDLAIAKKSGIHTRIIHAHSANIIAPFSLRIYKPIRKLYDYVATDWCACSVEAAQYLYSKKIIRNKKYNIINNGIHIKDFCYSLENRKKIRKIFGISEEVRVIGHVGRFTQAKNHDFIIDIFAEVIKRNDNYRLMLVGDGELKEKITKAISDNNLENWVILTGARSNIGELLCSFDLFLFPSVWEGLGISLVEAQCNGLRCFVSDKVPDKAIITSNVIKIELNKGKEYWADQILIDECKRTCEVEKIDKSGFDIMNSIKQLEKIYMK